MYPHRAATGASRPSVPSGPAARSPARMVSALALLLDYLQEAKEAASRTKALEKEAVAAARGGLLSADNNRQETSPESELPAGLLSADNEPAKVPVQGQPAEEGRPLSSVADAASKGAEGSPAGRGRGTPRVGGVKTTGEGADPALPDTEEASRDSQDNQPRRLPYDDAFYVVQHLHVKMTTEHFVQGARAWMKILREQHPEEYQALLLELAEQEHQPA